MRSGVHRSNPDGPFRVGDHTLRAIAKRFYEKVVKVKADVAAILKFFLLIPQIEADHHDAAPLVPIGGMRKGGFSAAV